MTASAHDCGTPAKQGVSCTSTVSLRDYQSRAIDLVRDEMRRGGKRVVLVLPTGAGKTRTAAAVVGRALARGSRVLWLAHRTELIDQTAVTLLAFGLPVSVIAASSALPVDPAAPVQIASIQTLLARDVRPPADLVIWDEAHHAGEGAATWTGVLDAYPEARVLGLTATPERGDGTGLAPLFDRLVVGITGRELTEAGHLVPCEVIRPARMLEAGQLAQDPVAAWRMHAGARQGFVFARTVAEAQRYAAELTAAGIRACCIHAGTPARERALMIGMFRDRTIRALCNVFVFTEGTDLPAASVCVLARGASSAGIYLQMVGRVLRPAPGKTDALLIDLRGVSHVHGMPEDERAYRLEGRAISLVVAPSCAVCKTPLDGGYPCGACGYAPDAGEKEAARDEVTGDPLERYARMIQQGPEQRHQTLVRWLRAADIKGHKRAAVRHKWRAVYRHFPSPDAWARACAEAGPEPDAGEREARRGVGPSVSRAG